MQQSLRGGLLAAALLTLSSPTTAQVCPGEGAHAWRNDSLPATPVGQLPISVVRGLCVGEGAASVFTLPEGSPPQLLTQVTCPFGTVGGLDGDHAAVNVQVFDGVFYDGHGNPIFGPKVFDLAAHTAATMQVESTGLNHFDMSPYEVVVGQSGLGNFVVAFVVQINPNGTCEQGYSANLFTDASSQPVQTDTTSLPGVNLVRVDGQSWLDATKATVGGVPLAPLYYNGNWAIRACTTDTTWHNPLRVQVAGSPTTPGGFVNLGFVAPGHEGSFYVAAASFGTSPGIPTPSGLVPLNDDQLFKASLQMSGVFVNFFGVIGPDGSTPGVVITPPDPAIAGLDFHVAFVTLDPAPDPWGISEPALIQIQ